MELDEKESAQHNPYIAANCRQKFWKIHTMIRVYAQFDQAIQFSHKAKQDKIARVFFADHRG